MSRQKLMKTIGIVMIVIGIGIGVFGVAMRPVWKVSSQIPKVYDWNTENLGEAPEVDNGDIDVDAGQPSVGENSTEGLDNDASVSENEEGSEENE